MRLTIFAAALASAAMISSASMAASPMPMDSPIMIDGINTVCTGIGDGAQNDTRWASYPIRIEFSNRAAQYLSGAHVVISNASGKPLSAFDCAGAWVLLQLPAGDYKVTANLLWNQGGGARSASFSPPASGQKRVVLQFPIGQAAAKIVAPKPKTTKPAMMHSGTH